MPPQALQVLFRAKPSKVPSSNALPILAVGGSDVVLPRNRSDKRTSFQTGPHHTPSNLIPINALYNFKDCQWLTSHVTIKTSKLKQIYHICYSDVLSAYRQFLRAQLRKLSLSRT